MSAPRTFYQATCDDCGTNEMGAGGSTLLAETGDYDAAREVAVRHFDRTAHDGVHVVTLTMDRLGTIRRVPDKAA